MFPHWGCWFVAAVMLTASQPALGAGYSFQRIAWPGAASDSRNHRVPLSQPGGAVISLPSSVAPPAPRTHDRDPRRADHGRDRLQRGGLRAAVRRRHRAPRPAHDGLRHRATHYRQIRPRRLCALARGGAAAGVEPERVDHPHPGDRRLHRPGGVAGLALEVSQFLLVLRLEDHRRSARSTSRRSRVICCWRAICRA